MPDISISLSALNNAWLRNQIDESQDYSSPSELINHLIEQARRVEAINLKLARVENSGFTDQSPAQILTEFKESLK